MTSQTGHVDESFVTIRACLGLLVVRLLVPGELLLRVEHFTAMAYIVFEFLLDVEVMPVFVLRQIRIPAKSLVAQTTLDGRVTGVAVGMFVQFLLGEKRLVAHGARKRLDAQVSFHMQLEVLLPIKILTALSALQRVYLEMSVEQQH